MKNIPNDAVPYSDYIMYIQDFQLKYSPGLLPPRKWLICSSSPHIDDAPDTVTLLHVRKGLVDAVQWLSVRDKFVDLQLPSHIIVDKIGQLGPTLDTSKRATFPYTAGDELERWDSVSITLRYRTSTP